MVRISQPAPVLRPFVRFYAHVEGRVPLPAVIQAVPARTFPAIEFTFGDPYGVRLGEGAQREAAHAIAVIGAQTHRRVCLEMQGHVETFVIVFQPGGLFHLFSVGSGLLTDQHFEGVAVLGGSVNELRCRLGEATAFAERVCVADRYLLRHWRVRGSCTGVTDAAAELLRRHGSGRVSDLAAIAGLSVRQLERRFTFEIGMPPKLFARVARFEGALQRKRQSPGLRWTDIAHELGYYDQPHMVRDFVELSGAAPSDVAPQVDLLVERELDGPSRQH